jgi:uncharacterized protein (DUF1697 family)
MPRLVAFLRAINVGGRNVKMEVLRAHFTALGLKEVETFIASGNVIFQAPARGAAALAPKIEKQLAREMGYEVDVFLRTEHEVAEIARHPAFGPAQVKVARAFCVGFLTKALDGAAKKKLDALRSEVDDFHVHGREVYWLCQRMQSESKFNNAVFERATGVRATWRSLSTIQKLAAQLS